MKLTGERVITSRGRHNPTWQRHVAAYRLVAPLVTGRLVLDLGCGIGHSYRLFGQLSIGLDRGTRTSDGSRSPGHSG